MIDTITIHGDFDFLTLEKLEQGTYNFTYDIPTPNGMMGTVYEHKRDDNAPYYMKYDAATKKLTLECSVPKFLFGNNLQQVSDNDIRRFFQQIEYSLLERFSLRIKHSWSHWKVSRMDVAWNFHVGGAVQDYIGAFSNVSVPRYDRRMYNDYETIEWFNGSARMMFYDKRKEVKKNYGDSILETSADGILRFEANFRTKALKKYSQNRWAGELVCERMARQLLTERLYKIGADRPFTIASGIQILNCLIEKLGINTAHQLYGFIKDVETRGHATVKQELSPATYSRRISDLKKAGVTLPIIDKELPLLDLGFLNTIPNS